MDIAELGLAIRSDGVVVAKDRLEALERTVKKTERATEDMTKANQRAEKALGVLKGALGAVLAAFGVQQLIQYTNTWTDLTSRVDIATGRLGLAAATMDRLSLMARRTYSSLELTAESFLLNSTALTQLGFSTTQQLDLTEALNNALVVSGAKGERAASVLNAWSKAMALGKLSGDELNTVISVGGRVAQALADSMGVSVLELRKLGSEGKITTAEMYGVTSQLERLREEADGMPATVGDAFTLLGNAVLTFVGKADQATGASARVAEAIIWLADNIEVITPLMSGLAAVVATLLVPAFFSATAAVVAFMASPIGIAAVVIFGVVAAVTALWNEQQTAERTSRELAAAIATNAASLDTARTASASYRAELRAQIETQLATANAALQSAQAMVVQRAAMANQLSGLPIIGGLVSGGMNTMNMVSGQDTINASVENVAALKSQLGELDEIIATIAPIPETVIASTNALSESGKAAADAIKAANDNMMAMGVSVTEQTLTPFELQANKLQELQMLLAEGAISWETYGRAAQQAQAGAVATTLGSLASMSSMLSSAFQDNKALAIANAVLKGGEAVVSSFAAGAALGGPPLGFAYAGVAAAATAAQIAAIASTSTSTKSAATPATSGAAPSVPNTSAGRAPAATASTQTIRIEGLDKSSLFTGESLEKLMDAISDRAGDGWIVKVA